MTTYSDECCCGRKLIVLQHDEGIFTHADGTGRRCWPDSEPDLMAEPIDWDVKQPMVLNPYQLTNQEIDTLADATQVYVDSFTDDDRFTMIEALRFTDVKLVLEKLGRKQEWDDDGA